MDWSHGFSFVICTIFLSLFTIGSDGHLVQMAARTLLPGKPSPPGSPWPIPMEWTRSEMRAALGRWNEFSYTTTVSNCTILNEALQRYDYALLTRGTKPNVAAGLPVLSSVTVQISPDDSENLCQEYPKLSTDSSYEAYEIYVGANPAVEDSATAVITAKTVWGALRGLETFSQLVWRDQDWSVNQFYVNFTEIRDMPRYPHRGLLLDTARHYLPPGVIIQILDGMAYNKLNVFHWHIIDDQSFPFVSEEFPELSAKGAFIPGYLEYNKTTVANIIEEARLRGIRVLFELDTPGHTYSFGKSHPELLTPCYGDGVNPGTPNYPQHAAYENLDPTRETTYEFIEKLFREIIEKTSKDDHIHLGMDEIYYPCWLSSPEIAEFMQKNNYTSIDQVQEHYTKRALGIVKRIGGKAIIWQDPIEFGVDVDKDVIVQVWKNPFGGWPQPWQNYMQMVLDEGYKTLLSGCWYINHLKYGQPWREYYDCDPVKSLPRITEEQQKLILGGEAAIWGEYVDATNIVSRLFPVVGTTAEKLWSPMDASTTDDAIWRLDEQRCRLIGRGINAQPLITSYCFPEELDHKYERPSFDD